MHAEPIPKEQQSLTNVLISRPSRNPATSLDAVAAQREIDTAVRTIRDQIPDAEVMSAYISGYDKYVIRIRRGEQYMDSYTSGHALRAQRFLTPGLQTALHMVMKWNNKFPPAPYKIPSLATASRL